jgi:DNA-binding MarR family transcriptional regulator
MDNNKINRFYSLTESIRKLALSNFHIGSTSKSEFFMLQFINFSNDGDKAVTTAVLSERLHISKPAVSQMINVLEKKEYVTREICKADRRVMRILLTDLGNKVLEDGKGKFLERIGFTLDLMGDEDSEVFITLLEKYFNIISSMHKNNI